MKQLTLALLLLTFAVGCKKEEFEKNIRKVTITFSEDGKYKPNGHGWINNCTRKIELYAKQNENVSFEAIVCNTPNMSVKVECAGKVLYEKNTKIHNVSVTIP